MSSDDVNNPNPTSNPIAGAITYPTTTEDMQPVPIQPRQPRNLQGLLRFAMEATKAEDAPGTSGFGPMDEESRKYLEQALKSLTVDVAEVVQKAIRVLSDTERIKGIQLGQPVPDDVKAAFDNLLEYIHDIDVSNDFYKLGGFAIFPVCYGSDNEEVRASASAVLGEVCQNNPYCQARALECGLLNVLLNLAAGGESGLSLVKTVYALSCATRGFEPSCKELVAQGGCATLARLLRNDSAAVRTKAAFLIRHLCQNYADAKSEFINRNLVHVIAEQIQKERNDSTEHLLGLLVVMTEGLDPKVLEQCRSPDLRLKTALQQLLSDPALMDEKFLEEKEYCRELLRLFENHPEQLFPAVCDDGPDR